MKRYFQSIRTYFILLLLVFYSIIVSAQNNTDEKHEITIYAIPTLKPFIWDSPSTLYSSMMSCYIKTIAVKNNYLFGHVIVRLQSHLVPGGELHIAQLSCTMKEKRDLIFKEKVGMAIMGVVLNGRIEPDETIREKLKIYADREKLAFIKYRISKEAMERILAFIDEYTKPKEDGRAEYEFYGGAFNPRFEHEGSGCSAFGLALLDLINLSPENPHEWAHDVNIPIELIGGNFNNHKKVKTKSILEKKEWYNSENGTENVDYVRYFIYDPSLMFDWILDKRRTHTTEFQIYDENNIPGLYKDARDVQFDCKEPLFKKRQQSNLFVDIYLKDRIRAKNQVKSTIKISQQQETIKHSDWEDKLNALLLDDYLLEPETVQELESTQPTKQPFTVELTERNGKPITIISEFEDIDNESKELAIENPRIFLPNLAALLNNLGANYNDQNDYSKAEVMFIRCSEIREELAKDNPAVYLPDLADILYNLGFNYRAQSNYPKAEAMFLRCLEIYEKLAKESPKVYLPDVTLVLNNLGLNYKDQREYAKAEEIYLRCLKIYEKLAKKDPNAYTLKLINVTENLASVCQKNKKYKKAVSFASRSVLLRKKFDDLPNNVASSLGTLSLYTLYTQEYSSSEEYALEALRLDSTQTGIKTNLAHALLLLGKYEEAWSIYQEISSQKSPESNKTYGESCVEDLESLLSEELVPSKHVEEVKKVLNYLKRKE